MGRERFVGATLAVAPCIQPYRRAPGDREGRPYGTVIELGAFIVRAVEDAGPYGTVIEPGACPARRGVVTPPYAQVPIEFRRAA